MIDSFLYAKMPPHSKRAINLAYLENGTYDQTEGHFEEKLELSGIENDGELPIPTMMITAATDYENKPDFFKTSCLNCKKLGLLIKDCPKRKRKEQEQKQDSIQNVKGFTPRTYYVCPHCQGANPSPEKKLKRSQCRQKTTYI